MKSEIKIAIILGAAIIVAIGTISILFSSLDSEFESTSMTESDLVNQIDK